MYDLWNISDDSRQTQKKGIKMPENLWMRSLVSSEKMTQKTWCFWIKVNEPLTDAFRFPPTGGCFPVAGWNDELVFDGGWNVLFAWLWLLIKGMISAVLAALVIKSASRYQITWNYIAQRISESTMKKSFWFSATSDPHVTQVFCSFSSTRQFRLFFFSPERFPQKIVLRNWGWQRQCRAVLQHVVGRRFRK